MVVKRWNRAPCVRMIELTWKDLQTGLIPSASGSALIEAGNTKIVCAVYVDLFSRKTRTPSSAWAAICW